MTNNVKTATPQELIDALEKKLVNFRESYCQADYKKEANKALLALHWLRNDYQLLDRHMESMGVDMDDRKLWTL